MATRAKKIPPNAVPPEVEPEQQRFWDWEVDGNVCEGVFVSAGAGFTKLGEKSPFLVVKVDDVERTVWAHHKALRSKIRERIEEYGSIEVGERVIVRRSSDKTTSEAGFEYFAYRVEWPDLPQKDQAELFGAGRKETPEAGGGGGERVDDDIPFMPA
jgi:hypothetical protein